jgi:hypothetical protein
MHTVNRLEIMADSVELHLLTAILNRTPNVTYTVFRNVTSHGVRGEETESGIALEMTTSLPSARSNGSTPCSNSSSKC